MIGVRLPRVESPRTIVRLEEPGDAPALLDYVTRNRAHFAPWDPRYPERYFSLEYQRNAIAGRFREYELGTGLPLNVYLRGDRFGRLLARITYSQITRGVFQNAILGYSVDREYEGRGLMTEALRATLPILFDEMGLHRIEAGFVPENLRSARVLERLGFKRVGLAPKYLCIDGSWRDHVLAALLNESRGPVTLD